jgi:oligo-1,6-glucosidase
MDRNKDFRRMSFYQIWIRSFADGNGDGIGDLYGVYDRLDYIKSLGVDAIWFSPVYPSPNADYGYDISDYRNIHPDYGTLDQFRKVLDRAHELGMIVLMDLVINHTSDEHPWFKESCKGKDNPYSDYYIWRDPRFKGEQMLPPNNWYSQFEGLAWEYSKTRGQYYLHVFAKKQPDLNMDNPKVREEVKGIMRFWLDMGVDGFREDVITYISKNPALPDGNPLLPMINGLPHYKDGPRLMEYLQEFREVAREYNAIQIGEAPFTPVKTAATYISGPDRVLDMMIQFDHMTADCIMTEYVWHRFMLTKLKKAFTKWQNAMNGRAWNCLYLENHDHPRVISRYGSEKFWRESGTCLAASYIFQQGCPFIYQGQEIGMTNIRLRSIDEYNDVSTINAYHTFRRHRSPESRMRWIHVSSRDSARTPVQWTDGKYAGFSTSNPWFRVNPNYKRINAAAQENDPDSILNFYRRCLALRRESETLIWGSYREYFPRSRKHYVYERSYLGDRYLIVCSFAAKETKERLPADWAKAEKDLVLGNYPFSTSDILHPYETRVYHMR